MRKREEKVSKGKSMQSRKEAGGMRTCFIIMCLLLYDAHHTIVAINLPGLFANFSSQTIVYIEISTLRQCASNLHLLALQDIIICIVLTNKLITAIWGWPIKSNDNELDLQDWNCTTFYISTYIPGAYSFHSKYHTCRWNHAQTVTSINNTTIAKATASISQSYSRHISAWGYIKSCKIDQRNTQSKKYQ